MYIDKKRRHIHVTYINDDDDIKQDNYDLHLIKSKCDKYIK